MAESRVEAWDRLERENAALRRALAPFARLANSPLGSASVEYTVRGDPERQTFCAAQMQRAFNRAAEVYAAHRASGVEGWQNTNNEFCPVFVKDASGVKEPIPDRVYWAPLADNFYDAEGRGQGNDFYRKWKPRCVEFPQGESAGWGPGSAHNPFKDPPPSDGVEGRKP